MFWKHKMLKSLLVKILHDNKHAIPTSLRIQGLLDSVKPVKVQMKKLCSFIARHLYNLCKREATLFIIDSKSYCFHFGNNSSKPLQVNCTSVEAEAKLSIIFLQHCAFIATSREGGLAEVSSCAVDCRCRYYEYDCDTLSQLQPDRNRRLWCDNVSIATVIFI